MDDEETSDLILDTIDFTPNLLAGFTASEMVSFFAVCFVILIIPCAAGSHYLADTILYGFILDAVISSYLTYRGALRAQVLKRNRPSYMMWIDLQRRLQDRGILGVKINFKLVPDAVWETKKIGR
ncbi:DUF3487 family protein [Vibrio sp. Y2-5]|uniref:DUF3487 family protein n=1 Tax=Vibrio sp. Y2-5 TaxID=2743977 RepID=UPI001660E533|nr:DUF3487 family protein [Vibrio sp. Y2-5]MBD0788033.1 DUF3487 family protein [Vibrio sp. Y2-5]